MNNLSIGVSRDEVILEMLILIITQPEHFALREEGANVPTLS